MLSSSASESVAVGDRSRPVPVVEVIGLARQFAGTPVVDALRPSSFTIDRGEFVAITGPSGSGKSTLLALLGLLDRPSAGELRLDGVAVDGLDERQRASLRAHRIGFVFQAFHLLRNRSVLENVEMGLLYQGIRRSARLARADEAIATLGLEHRRDALCGLLSGGEMQRVAIARALVRRPALMLCDEPTGNLDGANTAAVLAALRDVHRHGQTVVVITHDADVAAIADRRISMRDGSLLLQPVHHDVRRARSEDSP